MTAPVSPPPALVPPPPAPSGRNWKLVLGAALVAAVLSTFFFTPRFVVWRAFGVQPLEYNIEIFRSPYFLAQVAHPLARIENPSNQVIQWRLLFPLLAHFLHLPLAVLLVLPWVGCLLALGTTAQFLWQYTRDPRLVWLGTMLAATCSWYFVGTGWVLYFDGWLMTALLLATFARARWLLLLAASLTPWIDERFLLALPLCLTVRWVFLSTRGDYPWRAVLRDTAWLALGVSPYVALRVWGVFADVWQVHGYFDNKVGYNSPFLMDLSGTWQGLRAGWVVVLLLPVWLWRRRARALALGTLVVVAATVMLHVALAGDLSRSASIAVPALLAGVMIWPDFRSRWAPCALIAITVANFLLPAAHMVTVSRIPIFYLHTELNQWRNPPDQFNPIYYNALGLQLVQSQKPQDAYKAFSTAILLDPGLAAAFLNRGILLHNNSQKIEAMADLDRAVELDPHLWDARLNRALALIEAGQPAKAILDLEYLVDHAPADWPNLTMAKTDLATLRARGP